LPQSCLDIEIEVADIESLQQFIAPPAIDARSQHVFFHPLALALEQESEVLAPESVELAAQEWQSTVLENPFNPADRLRAATVSLPTLRVSALTRFF
jgi:hypothetical protein